MRYRGDSHPEAIQENLRRHFLKAIYTSYSFWKSQPWNCKMKPPWRGERLHSACRKWKKNANSFFDTETFYFFRYSNAILEDFFCNQDLQL